MPGVRRPSPEGGSAMTEAATKLPGMALTLTEEEREYLLNFLEQTFREALVEEHRTDAFDFKEYVRHKEAILKGLIDKLRHP
jgi:hypothetical protein